MKIILNINKIDEFNIESDYYLVGLKGFSDNFSLSLNDLKKYKNKKIFLSINNNLTNDDTKKLRLILKNIDSYHFEGIFFYDLALMTLKKELGFQTELVFNQTHLVTNYEILNLYQSLGVEMATLTSELSLDEIKEIKEKTKIKLMFYIYGYNVLAVSKRKLLSFYFEGINKPIKKEVLLKERDREIMLKEDDNVKVYNNKFFNGTDVLDLNLDYGIIDTFNLNASFIKDIIKNIKNNNIERLNELAGSYKGFLDKDLVYKVK